ncbi:NADH-quinone oxidoreductase subunit NuoE [Dyadobacter endophyticus]|uniref:NADH-quinone oxidoreductase subunit NuoE n=1 Tax=Dyadobacter TaxID=120831 RepID=UPI003CFB5B15
MIAQETLTPEEMEEIDHEIALVPVRRAAAIEALKIVQQHRGWISDDSLHAIAGYLEMSPEELDSVATFYNLVFRKPVGRNVILLCDSISCYVMGYEKIYGQLRERLGISFGQTTPDGRFTLLPNACLGTCDHAPALMINNELFRDVTANDLDEILDRYH